MDDATLNRFGRRRIGSRQVDELIGLARGIAADGMIHEAEVEVLLNWLVANKDIAGVPVVGTLYERVADILEDGVVDDDEKADLLATLDAFTSGDLETGEAMKATTLPLCEPAPDLLFEGRRYTFTGTFNYGKRKACEQAVVDRGGAAGSLTKRTDVLVIGVYATESWKHSSFGNKIVRTCELRDQGLPIHIVSEAHWSSHL